jgi:hypothetical protein
MKCSELKPNEGMIVTEKKGFTEAFGISVQEGEQFIIVRDDDGSLDEYGEECPVYRDFKLVSKDKLTDVRDEKEG